MFTVLSIPELAGVVVVVFLLGVWISYKIWIGRNWARIVVLVANLVGAIQTSLVIGSVFRVSPLLGTLTVAQNLLIGVSLFLLFTKPGGDWFKRRPRATAGSAQ